MKKTILIVSLMFTAVILSAQNKTALIIGNGQYKNDFSALTNPVPDVRKMADGLESIGFEVIRAYNVQSQDRFYALLEMFESRIKQRGGLARIKLPRNSLVVYAADAGESTKDRLFTPTLLKYLTRSGWSLNQVLQRTRVDVLSSSGGRQSPGEYSQLLSGIYLGASGGASARPNAPNPSFSLEQSYGSLRVSVQTSGTLYLDGKSMGRISTGSRAKLIDIPTGRHNLEMRYGGQSGEKSVMVQENRSLAVAFSWVEQPEVPEDYVLVEGGTFRMGSPSNEEDRDDDEGPVHSVTVGSFYMKATEVTQKEWQEVMETNPSVFKGDDRPVEDVSWFDVVKYCNALSERKGRTPVYWINGGSVTANWSADGYRLPTEAEWEYAARGGNQSRGYKYVGSNNVGEVGWYSDNFEWGTHPVKGKKANELGLYDMSGNVYEWCWDWYGDYPSGQQTDPIGPSSGSDRVLRGGGWPSGPGYLRVANREGNSPGYSELHLGFRLVLRTN